MYAYLILVGASARDPRFSFADPRTFEALDLQVRFRSDTTLILASPDTSVMGTLDDGVIIGHLFGEDGTPVSAPPTAADVERRIVSALWGEYVLVKSSTDGDRAKLTVTRDPSGGVACVYSLSDSTGFITSDVSLATRLGLYVSTIDWTSIAHCLAYPYVKASRTALAHVRELLPGCSIDALCGTSDTSTAWTPWAHIGSHERYRDPKEAAADVRQAVAKAVAAWARLDSGPILMELSGGLDSSVIAACLQPEAFRVIACTLVTPVPGADERHYAGLVAQHLGIELVEEDLRFDQAHYEFPVPRSSSAPRIGVLQHAADEIMLRAGERRGATSYFSGGGGDTVFGYLMNAAPAADAFKSSGVSAGLSAIRDLSQLHQCTFWKAARLTLRKLLYASTRTRVPDLSFLAERAAVPMEVHPWTQAPRGALPGDCDRVADLVGTQAFRDGLPRGGKAAVRMPLLSQPVVETCLRVPSWMWVAGGRNRAIARDAFAADLPAAAIQRRSKGNFMGYTGACYRRNQKGMRDFLLNGELAARGLLDTKALRQFMDRELAIRDQSFMRILTLCMIENWVRQKS
ncbi:asparagine synthase-related protein [Luteimonas terrae]|uniref:asparagine synthase (glutamine-hydrolyzing) n=1 Tax=Luteimonas terrae TaxID=1530191 RepID=A0ABU1XSS1_9GAMM|nr:asparagine synthase-related protein [Luteimonas terrae]MDR7191805.1 asparagine synthase (glutamine-hydrolyzing) [Luteimonas terrae]